MGSFNTSSFSRALSRTGNGFTPEYLATIPSQPRVLRSDSSKRHVKGDQIMQEQSLMLITQNGDEQEERDEMLKMKRHVDRSRKFLKVAKDYTDVYIDKLPLKSLNDQVAKASEGISVGKFMKWTDQVTEEVKPPSYTNRIMRAISRFFGFGKNDRHDRYGY
jgi:hypothetical protein